MEIKMSDEMLSAVVPVIVYWVFSGIYELLGIYFVNHRLHPKGEENEKNAVSKLEVIKGVLTQQALQITILYLVTKVRVDDEKRGVPKPQPSLPVIALQWFIGMIVVDTVQYFGHRYLHANKFLYKHVHSTHHALVVPYVYGALYGHPLEGLFLDIIGSALAFLFSGMTPRTSIYFFSFSTIKGLDLHCALYFPWNPLQAFFPNNCAFHYTHHQIKGHKYNYAQPFFISWDKILGTYKEFTVEKREGGGFRVSLAKNQ
ncbi:hypothetical protein J5N97_017270 [Dioscorea zingiberensis]|uniref:aldehyde oxygenase (deformylating) n=1 Tax=Dioscorea zingiberensis TaxID=325984 RepID=A0A9D5CLF2_9LILI|nr:hypothetical protein J5N97_017270 [Dioscorea zingiberensis]